MEAAAMSAAVNVVLKSVMGSLFPLLKKEYNKHKGLVQEIQSIERALAMIAAAMDTQLGDLGRHERPAVARLYREEIVDLTHDFEDCVDRFKHQLKWKPPGSSGAVSSTAQRLAHKFKKAVQFPSSCANDIEKLKMRLKEVQERVKNSVTVACCGQQHSGLLSASMVDCSNLRSVTRSPVGIEKPMEHLLSLLHEVDGEQQRLRVVSIVGFSGLGKTTLAKAVYDSRRAKETFPCRAWVSAATGNGNSANFRERIKAILCEILKQVVRNGSMNVDINNPEASLKKYLGDKRYLIVIDDIQMIGWRTLNSAFEDNGTGSRIILTTSIQSEANRCCSHGNGHVYQMDTLGEENSKEIAFVGTRSPELDYGSKSLLGKCDGLPLALVSVSDYLMSSNQPTGKCCATLCRNLGSHLNKMHGNDSFSDLRKVLLDNYDSLSCYALSCLLYLGIFPNNRPLRRKVIIRRWLAEGYARSESLGTEQDIADENFDRLIDWNIIRPIETRNNSQVKTCKIHGIMHEFVLEKSLSQRFIMTPSPGHSRSASANNARHLSVHAGKLTTEFVESDEDLSRVRSLTVFGAAGGAIAYIRKCKLIRVLDLEECNDLKDNDLEHICKLWHLKYLSLGDTIQVLPRCIDGLHCLETLDLRRTKIESLPIEAIQLPHLIHLFGKIMLDKDDLKNVDKWSKLKKFLSGKKSNLRTLAGFVTDNSKVFLQLINGMSKLRKVKIWCKGVAYSSSYISDLSRAIQKFTKVPLDTDEDCSFSLDLEEPCENLLGSLNLEPCSEGSKYDLKSLKLNVNGKLLGLPPFVTLLSGLTDLCISSVTLTLDLISALAHLDKLLYLKLVANLLEDFKIQHGAFPSLRHLCFQVQSLTSGLLTIQQGALPNLVSLQLLYQGLVGLSGINIRHFKHLKEVTIDDNVTAQTRQDWEQAAKKHPNRPRVITLVSTSNRMDREEPAANPAIGTATMASSSSASPLHAVESVPLSKVPVTEAGELNFMEQAGHRLNAAEELQVASSQLPTNKPPMEAEEPENDEHRFEVGVQDDQVVGDGQHEHMTFTELQEMDPIIVLVEHR